MLKGVLGLEINEVIRGITTTLLYSMISKKARKIANLLHSGPFLSYFELCSGCFVADFRGLFVLKRPFTGDVLTPVLTSVTMPTVSQIPLFQKGIPFKWKTNV